MDGWMDALDGLNCTILHLSCHAGTSSISHKISTHSLVAFCLEGGELSVGFRIGILSTAGWFEMLQRAKKVVKTIYFAKFCQKMRVKVQHFPHFSPNIGVETIQIFQRPEKGESKWRSIRSNHHVVSTLPGYKSQWKLETTVYRQVSNIRCTLVGNKIVDHSDVVGASPVAAAPTTSPFST